MSHSPSDCGDRRGRERRGGEEGEVRAVSEIRVLSQATAKVDLATYFSNLYLDAMVLTAESIGVYV